MPELRVIEAVRGPSFVRSLRRAWDDGAAVLPLEPGNPRPAPGAVQPGTAAVIATSGSSGEPRLVELSRAALDAAVETAASRLGAEAGDRWSVLLPVHHIAGFMAVLRSLAAGAEPSFDRDTPSAFMSLVPTQLKRMLDEGFDLTEPRAILVGGGRVPPDLLRSARERGASVIVTYGQTETCGGVVYDGLPLPGTELDIRDGRLFLRGPTVMSGYLADPVATSAKLIDGWLDTGDLAELRDGVLRISGRADDIVKTGGEKVSLEKIERVLSSHPSVSDVAVAGVEDAEWGHRIVAFVVSGGALDAQDIKAWASDRLARHELPKEFLPIDRIPRTALGKIRRTELPMERPER